MASPEAKYRMLEREARRLRIIAEAVGTPEEIERFEQTRNQPTFGDPEMARIFTERAVADLLQSANGIEIEEDDLSEDAQIKKYNATTGEMEDYQTTSEKLASAEAQQGQPLQDADTPPGDEADAPSDEEVQESYGETDVIPGERQAAELRATPAAVRKADELGVSLSEISGTGAAGRVTSGDVERHASSDSSDE